MRREQTNMEDEMPKTELYTIVAIDTSNDFSYLVCSKCEKPLYKPLVLCKFCNRNAFKSKRLFRFLMSIASNTRVFTVVCFNRAAKVLFGCSADEFLVFARSHPFAAANAGRILEGEMCRITLAKPKNVNSEHLRVASVVPLSSGFQPVIHSLKELYEVSTRS